MHDDACPALTTEKRMSPRRTLTAVTTAAVALLLTSACAVQTPGPQRTEDRMVPEMNKVELAMSGDLVIRSGPTPKLTVTAGEAVIRSVTSEVRDGRLVLDVDGYMGRLGEVRWDLVLPAVEAVTVSGSGHVEVVSTESPDLALVVEGSGDIDVVDAAAEAVTADITGSGRIAVTGTSARQEVRIEGSGIYQADQLDSREATVVVEGSGTADVQVSGRLDARVSGSGSVRYTGDAAVTKAVDGSGEVITSS